MKNRDILILPNAFVLGEILESFTKGKSVSIPIKGQSMKPFLSEGDHVVVKPFDGNLIKRGLIVLANRENTMVLHRVVKYNKNFIWLAGDGNLFQKEQIGLTDVIAVAILANRKGKSEEINGSWNRFLGLSWYYSRPLRRIILKLGKGFRICKIRCS